MELYSGPSHIVHYKYAGIFNVVFVTMVYGMGLPVLFPIAALSIFIMYATERYMIAYHYKMPPQMDDLLTKNAMTVLSFAPILFLLNTYWMLSNRQMFENTVNSKQFSYD